MNLETMQAKIKSFQSDKRGPYGDVVSSKQSIDVALRILRAIAARTEVVADAVQADGVILKYLNSINVEIDDDGTMLVFDQDNHDYEFSGEEIEQCVDKIESLICRVA